MSPTLVLIIWRCEEPLGRVLLPHNIYGLPWFNNGSGLLQHVSQIKQQLLHQFFERSNQTEEARLNSFCVYYLTCGCMMTHTSFALAGSAVLFVQSYLLAQFWSSTVSSRATIHTALHVPSGTLSSVFLLSLWGIVVVLEIQNSNQCF